MYSDIGIHHLTRILIQFKTITCFNISGPTFYQHHHIINIPSPSHYQHSITGLHNLGHTMPPDYLLCITKCYWTTYFVSHNATGLFTWYHTMPLDYLLCLTQCHRTTLLTLYHIMPPNYLLCIRQCHSTTYFVTQCHQSLHINTNKIITSTLQDHLITLQHFTKTITSTL